MAGDIQVGVDIQVLTAADVSFSDSNQTNATKGFILNWSTSTNNTATPQSMMGIGQSLLGGSAGNIDSVQFHEMEDLVSGNSDGSVRSALNRLVVAHDPGTTTIETDFTPKSYDTSGMSITHVTSTQKPYVIGCSFGGADCATYSEVVSRNTTVGFTTTVDFSGTFTNENYLVFVQYVWNVATGSARSTWGCAAINGATASASDAVIDQWGVGFAQDIGIATTVSYARAENTMCLLFPLADASGILASDKITQATTGQFEIENVSGTGAETINVMVVNTDNRACWAGVIDTPTSTGSFTAGNTELTPDITFTPQALGVVATKLTALATDETGAKSETIGFGYATEDGDHASGVSVMGGYTDGISTTDEACSVCNESLMAATGDGDTAGAIIEDWDFSTFTSTGFTATVNATSATSTKWLGWAVEAVASGGVIRVPLASHGGLAGPGGLAGIRGGLAG